jgi:polar amino acid transport system substrate-binding protein
VASSASTGNAACAKGALRLVTPRTLTVGTGKPASEPWFKADNPANGQGFESAVAYAVAEQLGFGRSEVSWVTVPFDASSAPGRKSFDFDINQISITEARREAVDLSKGYYDVTQAVVALRTSPVADATTIAELKDAKLAARAGSTSLQAIQQTVRPAQQPAVHNDDNDTRTAVQNGAVDAAVFDLPTAFRLVAAEIGNAKIVGQFPSPAGLQEQFGMLFEKGNPLVSCVNQALATLRSGGQLAKIQQQWLAGSAGAPELK